MYYNLIINKQIQPIFNELINLFDSDKYSNTNSVFCEALGLFHTIFFKTKYFTTKENISQLHSYLIPYISFKKEIINELCINSLLVLYCSLSEEIDYFEVRYFKQFITIYNNFITIYIVFRKQFIILNRILLTDHLCKNIQSRYL